MSAEEPAEQDKPDSVRELTDTMRELRTRSGLTLAALAQRTNVSKSSWERYLNGKKFPPRTAVMAFARAVGVKPDRLLLLWDLAARTRHRAAERERPGQAGESTGDQGEGEDAVAARTDVSDGQKSAREDTPPSREPLKPPAAPRAAVMSRLRGLPTVLRSHRAVVVGVVACGLLLGSFTVLRGGGDDEEPSIGAPAGKGNCVGFECRGKDPGKQECDQGAWTAELTEMSGSWVELRYSPSCRAAWARITLAEVGDSARVVNITSEETEEKAISFDSDVYSPMVDAPFPGAVRACGVKPRDKGKPEVHCTDPGGSTPVELPSTSPSNSSSTSPSNPSSGEPGEDTESPEATDTESARRAEEDASASPQAS